MAGARLPTLAGTGARTSARSMREADAIAPPRDRAMGYASP
jgi:hypothetical protein